MTASQTTLIQNKDLIINQFAGHVSSGKAAFFQFAGIDFVPGKREGAYMWDLDETRKFINCHCNGGVFNLGHRNPAIVQTMMDSLQTLDIGNHHLISKQRAELAAKLAELTPGDLSYTVFGVGGGEAVDLAIKVARGYTGKPKIISANGGYHGHTGLALATGDAKYFEPFGTRPPGFEQVAFGDIGVLETAVSQSPTAAIILETIPATLGMPIPPPDYLRQVRNLCNRTGTLLILDEIQTGLGRTGTLWACEQFGVVPDIMVIGKGLSGGIYPMSATCFSKALETVFHDDPFIHISTFGGAEIGCPVALKVLEMSSESPFLENVATNASIFAEGFQSLQLKHPHVLVGLRQIGLMMGIEMVNEYCGPLFSKAAYDNGLISVYAYNDSRVAQLLPPLIVERPLVEEIIERADAALGDVTQMLGG